MAKAYENFKCEMERLELLHGATLYAYDQAILRSVERVEQGYSDSESSIKRDLATDYKYNVFAANIEDLLRQFRSQHPNQLREILLVRVISTLEAFMVDTLREVFLVRKDLFHKNDNIVQYSYAQILSFDSISQIATQLINKECRSLQNAGFSKFLSYYEKNLKITFNKPQLKLKDLQEFHERRHLLVHRLGKTDQKYRRDYNVADKRLVVNKRYLLYCFETVRAFAEFVYIETKKLRREKTLSRNKREPTAIAYVEVKPLSGRGVRAVRMDYSFLNEEEIILVKDIVFSKAKNSDESYSLGLQGSVSQVDSYIEYLRHCENKGRLKITDVRFARRITRKSSLSYAFLNRIEKVLPLQPWPKTIDEQIANKFGISARQSKQAIKVISERYVTPETVRIVSDEIAGKELLPGIHIEIASKIGLTEKQAYHAIKQAIYRSKYRANER